MNKTYISILGLLLPLCAYSQQVNTLPSRSLTIEGVYNAEVTDAPKIMPVPDKMKIQTSIGQTPDYITSGQPYMNYDRAAGTAPDAPLADVSDKDGLIKLGYGVRGDLDVLADYRIKTGKTGLLTFNAAANGWNTKIEDEWRSKLYDLSMNVGYSVTPKDKFKIDVNGKFCYGFLNFRPSAGNENVSLDDRNLFGTGLTVAFKPVEKNLIDYSINVGWDMGLDDNVPSGHNKGIEHIVKVKGDVGYHFSDVMLIGADVAYKSAFYDCATRVGSFAYDDNMSFSFTPFWGWSGYSTSIKAGASLSFFSGLTYTFRVSPYIDFNYVVNDKMTLSARVDGGIDEYDMRYLHSLSPYWSSSSQIIDGYTPFNAKVDVVWNISDSWALSAHAGYRKYFDKTFQLSYRNRRMESFITQSDADLLSGGLALRYVQSSRLSAYASFDYDKWSCATEAETLLSMLPCLTATVGGKYCIIEKLTMNIDYKYSMMTKCNDKRLPYEAMLDVSFRYRLMPSLDLTLSGTNLLNNKYYRFAGYHNQGLSVVASAIYRF